jgi:septal ring-binding cell division protein DamX
MEIPILVLNWHCFSALSLCSSSLFFQHFAVWSHITQQPPSRRTLARSYLQTRQPLTVSAEATYCWLTRGNQQLLVDVSVTPPTGVSALSQYPQAAQPVSPRATAAAAESDEAHAVHVTVDEDELAGDTTLPREGLGTCRDVFVSLFAGERLD